LAAGSLCTGRRDVGNVRAGTKKGRMRGTDRKPNTDEHDLRLRRDTTVPAVVAKMQSLWRALERIVRRR
jgi:hypothetical protein